MPIKYTTVRILIAIQLVLISNGLFVVNVVLVIHMYSATPTVEPVSLVHKDRED